MAQSTEANAKKTSRSQSRGNKPRSSSKTKAKKTKAKKTKQNKTKQNKAKQNKAKQNKAKQKGKGKKESGSPSPESTGARRAESARWMPGDKRQLLARSDVDRPHIRLGFLWGLLVIAALALGPIATAAVYGLTAAVAALQSAIAWKRSGTNPNRVVAGVVAVAVPMATGAAEWGLGAAMLIGVAASVLTSGGSGAEVVRNSAITIRCWLFAGLAAASVVAAYHFNVWAGVSLVALSAAYDAGDYIFGADARHRWIGLIAGSCAVAVVAFSLWVVQMAPFGGDPVFVFAMALVLTAPLGQVVASLVLPDGRALASGLRRLDTLIVAGPVWVLLLWYYPL